MASPGFGEAAWGKPMGLNTDQERKAQIVQRAWWLAMSGWCSGWREVETRLLTLGYAEAPRWLRDEELRRAMDRVCTESQDAALAVALLRPPSGQQTTRCDLD
jgi:hypothetical protein